MRIADSVALVTGASRGLGRAFVEELAKRGAATIYAGARDPSRVTGPGVPVALDVTDPEQVAAAARRCADVMLLVNNAGVMALSPLIGAPTMDGARQEMETNYFGTLAMCRAFAPVLAAGGGGAIVNMLSVVSWFTNPVNGSYGASKAAAWALTNGVRIELARQGTLVVGVHAGFVDTEMAAELAGDAPKLSPAEVARQVFDEVLHWAATTPGDGGTVVLDQPWVQLDLARAEAELSAMWLLNWRMAAAVAADEVTAAESSSIKVFGTERTIEIYRLLLGIVGAGGYLRSGSPGALLGGQLEALARQAQINTFGGGVNEVQREIVAMAGLGMRRAQR